jgi:hypothetical protein
MHFPFLIKFICLFHPKFYCISGLVIPNLANTIYGNNPGCWNFNLVVFWTWHDGVSHFSIFTCFQQFNILYKILSGYKNDKWSRRIYIHRTITGINPTFQVFFSLSHCCYFKSSKMLFYTFKLLFSRILPYNSVVPNSYILTAEINFRLVEYAYRVWPFQKVPCV